MFARLPSLTRLSAVRWDDVRKAAHIKLYAGDLPRSYPQYHTHYGLSPQPTTRRTIKHDIRDPMPLAENTVTVYQAEDVLEHIEPERLGDVIADIYRVLKPGGLFRLSVPDYRFNYYAHRCVRKPDGTILFDPGGGGRLVNGRPALGAHLWFPTTEVVLKVLQNSPFGGQGGQIRMLHGYLQDGTSLMEPIDYKLGFIQRTPDHDPRGRHPYRPVSIVADCLKM